MQKTPWSTLCLFLIFLVSLQTSVRADWPTYLGDNARSGSTAEGVDLPLFEQWVYSPPSAPRRAWAEPEGRIVENKELRDRVKFDDAFQVAVVGDRLFFGSSVDHQVHCRDLKTGESLWTFFTGAPVRLAPTVAENRVYVGSDDGYAYCLDARDGRLIWKLRLGIADERFIARGEMISRWPVRTGVLVEGGVAYFGAGIFPHENIYLGAADAETGELLWKNDHVSHTDAGRNDLSPQGYLLSTADRLYVPSARSQPKAVDLKTGQLTGTAGGSLRFTETAVAGTDALIADGRLYTFSLGTRLAASGESSYVLTGSYLARMDRKAFGEAEHQRAQLTNEIRTLSRKLRDAGDQEEEFKKQIADWQQKLKEIENDGIVWKSPCTAEAALMVADDVVFAGDKGTVAAFNAADGQEVWKVEVDGEARGLAVAEGNLLVSTTSGKIYCFGKTPVRSDGTVAHVQREFGENPYPNDRGTALYETAAEQILEQSNVTRGFCLVIGSEHGRLAYELAKRSNLKIYGVEPDERKVQASRRALSGAGIYGSRVTIHHMDPSAITYSNYFANLIVSDRFLLDGRLPAFPGQLARHLKPAGGVVVLGTPDDAPGASVAAAARNGWLKNLDLADQSNSQSSKNWSMLTRGTLPGAANWSHQYAEPGNTAGSGDKRVKGGLGVLWFGDPGPDRMVNRHQGAVGPLVVNGRLFVQGTDSLMAYDTYNGLFLWEHTNPRAIRTGVFQNRTPGNLAAGDDSLFHMIREQVVEHDAATGRVKAIHELPPSVDKKTHEWGYMAYRDGLLIGTATIREVIERKLRRRGDPGATATDAIFAIDVETGEHLWQFQGNSIAFQTIALGPGRVFFIDSTITSAEREALLRQDKENLKTLTGDAAKEAEARMKQRDLRRALALDARTGDEVWSKPVDVTDCSEIGIGGGKLTLMYSDGVLVLCGANANGHYWRQFVAGEFKQRRLVSLSAENGNTLWAMDANYRHRPIVIGRRVIAEPWSFDLQTGKQHMRQHPLTGKEVPWSIMRPGHHCGMLTGCENLLMFRSGYTGFYDLQSDSGTRHFAGHRLGCWINAIPTNGLVVVPEASAGCVCMFSIASTIVMEPREPRRPWTLFSAVGATTPVARMAINFGAPGDRRDARGKLWLAYPRPTPNPRLETGLDLALDFEPTFVAEGGFFSHDGDAVERSASEWSWVASSGGRGLKRLSIPLLGEGDPAASYTVRLYFSGEPGDERRERVCDVKLQGKVVLEGVEAAPHEGADGKLEFHEVSNVEVKDRLVIELLPKAGDSEAVQLPILCAMEVERVGSPQAQAKR